VLTLPASRPKFMTSCHAYHEPGRVTTTCAACPKNFCSFGGQLYRRLRRSVKRLSFVLTHLAKGWPVWIEITRISSLR